MHCLLLELTLSWLSRQVKSKTVAQCVEYYYTWKKITRLGRKHRTRLTETIDDCVVSEAAELSHILAPLPPHTQVSKWLVFGLTSLPRWPQKVGDKPAPWRDSGLDLLMWRGRGREGNFGFDLWLSIQLSR